MHCAATGVVVRGFDRPLSGDEITTASVADGRYEPPHQVDRSTADLKTAVAESFDDSSLRSASW